MPTAEFSSTLERLAVEQWWLVDIKYLNDGCGRVREPITVFHLDAELIATARLKVDDLAALGQRDLARAALDLKQHIVVARLNSVAQLLLDKHVWVGAHDGLANRLVRAGVLEDRDARVRKRPVPR